MQQIDDFDEPSDDSWVPQVIVSALTLTVLVVLLVVFMLPVERVPERPFAAGDRRPVDPVAAITGTARPVEKGGLAEMYDHLNRAATPAAAPHPERITVYLVRSAAEAEALVQFRRAAGGADELRADEMVLVAGTPEEEARADAILRELETPSPDGPTRVVDLRLPPVTDATDMADTLGTAEDWRAWLGELYDAKEGRP